MTQWHGGKGDKNRTSNGEEFRSSYDRIFRKPKVPSYKLFLDDNRVPEGAHLYDSDVSLLSASSTRKIDWEIVRSYDAFVKMIDERGIPEVVSFDNDLNNDHMEAYVKASMCGYYEWENLKKTGIHCAIYLKNKCKELGVKFPKYYIHSANQFARPILRQIIEDGIYTGK